MTAGGMFQNRMSAADARMHACRSCDSYSMNSAVTVAATLSKLTGEAAQLADCCVGLSLPLLEILITRLPVQPAIILSIGCGTGILEALLLHRTSGQLNIFGVEVPSCVNKYLPQDKLLEVPDTASIHPDAMLASTLMFAYPRQPSLVAKYLEGSIDGALEQVIWVGHRSDWADVDVLLRAAFHNLEIIEDLGVAAYELVVVASLPKALQC